jgi:hypothetical protein
MGLCTLTAIGAGIVSTFALSNPLMAPRLFIGDVIHNTFLLAILDGLARAFDISQNQDFGDHL